MKPPGPSRAGLSPSPPDGSTKEIAVSSGGGMDGPPRALFLPQGLLRGGSPEREIGQNLSTPGRVAAPGGRLPGVAGRPIPGTLRREYSIRCLNGGASTAESVPSGAGERSLVRPGIPTHPPRGPTHQRRLRRGPDQANQRGRNGTGSAPNARDPRPGRPNPGRGHVLLVRTPRLARDFKEVRHQQTALNVCNRSPTKRGSK